MSWQSVLGVVLGMLLTGLVAAEPSTSPLPAAVTATTTAVVPATPPWGPTYVRVDVPAGETRQVPIELHLPAATTLLTAETDCRCVSLVEATPRALPAGRSTLNLRVVGLLPGVKALTLRTTAGAAQLTIQVAVPGAADGQAVLAQVVAEATAAELAVVAIVHDLRGRLANCGCATGSLGGVGPLARLPETLRATGRKARCVLTGEIAGAQADLPAALAAVGWELRPADLPVTADPVAALARPGLLAVLDISDGRATPAHQRIIRPMLAEGAVTLILLVDATGQIRGRHVLPIDRSLPADTAFAARFREPQTIRIDPQAQPATSCQGCHAAAHATWQGSAHAQAWAHLPASQRVDACVTCHSTAQPGKAERAPAVQCTACHTGTAAHAAAPTQHTTGRIDCRTCHDAAHHPGFDPVASWLRIQHGK